MSAILSRFFRSLYATDADTEFLPVGDRAATSPAPDAASGALVESVSILGIPYYRVFRDGKEQYFQAESVKGGAAQLCGQKAS
jgi:hypothetical protein